MWCSPMVLMDTFLVQQKDSESIFDVVVVLLPCLRRRYILRRGYGMFGANVAGGSKKSSSCCGSLVLELVRRYERCH